MSADESASLLSQLSHALQQDGTGAGIHAAMMAVLEASVNAAADLPGTPPVRLVDAAIALGERRRTAGTDAEAVIEDYQVLRQAIRRVLRALPQGSDEQVAALERLDVRTTLSMRASLLGHSRPRLERAGLWAAARREFIDEAERTCAASRCFAPDDHAAAARR